METSWFNKIRSNHKFSLKVETFPHILETHWVYTLAPKVHFCNKTKWQSRPALFTGWLVIVALSGQGTGLLTRTFWDQVPAHVGIVGLLKQANHCSSCDNIFFVHHPGQNCLNLSIVICNVNIEFYCCIFVFHFKGPVGFLRLVVVLAFETFAN